MSDFGNGSSYSLFLHPYSAVEQTFLTFLHMNHVPYISVHNFSLSESKETPKCKNR